MNFEVLNIRRIDPATGYFKLHQDYILSYDHYDGWTQRLLRAGIYIDIIYECKVEIRFYTKNQDKFEKQFECEIPSEIKNIISEIMDLDDLVLKHNYADGVMEDFGDQHFVINNNGISHNIGVGFTEKKRQPENSSEKLFFVLIDLFEKWLEKLYQECLQESVISSQTISNDKPNVRIKRKHKK
ncbi:hypothetical protein [Flavobacterium phragmitis]|uniref:Uncharacterized protein n=1 Tax=Flavobacterium phragmitis TaxID=739143 RepID=A0A1I1U265_9FLAO|nr:hypothetical protein [Flavobacterium phragmitis]SFD64961.1 hypothetical protein SAMN05216297_110153 [Flavobacterium phragmitis]